MRTIPIDIRLTLETIPKKGGGHSHQIRAEKVSRGESQNIINFKNFKKYIDIQKLSA
jgi:hypothetical protein